MAVGGGPDGPDWMDFGPASSPEPRRRLRRWIIAAAAVVVVLAWAASQAFTPSRESALLPEPTPPAPSSRAPRPAPSSATPTAAGPVVISDDGPFVPDLSGDLFARSDDTVYRFELESGRVTATDGANVASTGPGAFVAGPDRVIIRPFDSVPGIVVRDRRRAVELTGNLREGGEVFPGPAGYVWANSNERYAPQPRMTLTDLAGRPTSQTVTATGSLSPDGRGNLLLSDVGGVWEVPRNQPRRITTGTVAAVGVNHYLLVDCDDKHRCSSYLYDRKSQKKRRLGPADTTTLPSGAISPDGRYAALLSYEEQNMLEILDLASNKPVRRARAAQNIYQASDVFVWSPDSRWLFALQQGELTLVDPTSGRTVTPDLRLPELLQIALRPSGASGLDR